MRRESCADAFLFVTEAADANFIAASTVITSRYWTPFFAKVLLKYSVPPQISANALRDKDLTPDSR